MAGAAADLEAASVRVRHDAARQRHRALCTLAGAAYGVRMTIDCHQIKAARTSIARIARKMIAGECSYIEGSRLICGLLDAARLDRGEPPFVTFVAIISETDAIPLGRVLDLWSENARKAHEKDWRAGEEWARSFGEAACRAAVSVLSNEGELDI